MTGVQTCALPILPLETRTASSYILAFDNTGSLATGVAVANTASAAAVIPVIVRDDTGAQITTGTVNLPAQGHDSFTVNQKFAAAAGKRGTIEFDTSKPITFTGTVQKVEWMNPHIYTHIETKGADGVKDLVGKAVTVEVSVHAKSKALSVAAAK